MLQNPDVDLVQARLPDDDLLCAIVVEIAHGQRAEFVAGGLPGPARLEVASVIVDRDVASAGGDHDLQVAIASQVGHDDAWPDAAARRIDAPLYRTVFGIQDEQGVGRADDFHVAVIIQVGDSRGSVPAGLAPGGVATAVLPFESRHIDLPWGRGMGGGDKGAGEKQYQGKHEQDW